MKLINRFVVGVILTLFIAVPTFAQVIEEIAVTARKKEEALQDVAITVNALTGEMLERLGIKDLNDLTKMDPSLTFDQGFAPDDIRISIRGITNNRGRPVVANVVDGVDISSEAMSTAGSSSLISPRMMDLARVEVVKGPQVALYGRTAFAGAIQYVTKDPSKELENVASLDVAQNGFHEARISSSGPISDTMGFRFNALAWDFDGFHTNQNTGAFVGGGEGVSAAITFLIEPNDQLRIKTRLDYVSDNYDVPAYAKVQGNKNRAVPQAASMCNGGFVKDASCDNDFMWLEYAMAQTPADKGLIPYASPWYPLKPAYPGGPMIPDSTKVGFGSTGQNADRHTGLNYAGRFDDMVMLDYDGFYPDGSALSVNMNRASKMGYNKGRDMFGSTKEGARFQSNIDYSGDNVLFSSWTHVANMDVSQNYDLDKEVLRHHSVEVRQDGPTKLFSQELRIATENDGPFNFTGGVLYWHEKMTQNSKNTTGMAHGSRCLIRVNRDYFGNVTLVEDLGLSYFAGPCGYTDTEIAPHLEGLNAARVNTPLERDTNHTSIYMVFDYDFSEKMSTSIEMRYTDERERMTGPVYGGNGGVDSCPNNPYGDCIDAPSGGPGSVMVCGSSGRCDNVGIAFVKTPATVPNGWRGYSPLPMNVNTFTTDSAYLSPKITLSYQVNDDILMFGSYSEARKPGGISTLSVGSFSLDPNADGLPTETQYDEEVMAVYELGAKSIWLDGSLRLNGAFFFEDYTDRQVSIQRLIGDQLGNVVENAAGGQVFGFEYDMQWALSENVMLSGGYAYLDAEYTDFTNLSTGAGEISRAGNCTIESLPSGESACRVDRSGNAFERAPKHSANINLNYTDELMNSGVTFFTDLNARYQDKRAIDFDNNAWLKEYWRLDLRIGFYKDNWEGTLYVENLLDDDTVITGGNGPDIGNSDFRFGMVFTNCQPYPGGPYIGYCAPGTNPNGKVGGPSVTAGPSIGNAWYASMPDPRQVGMKVTYRF